MRRFPVDRIDFDKVRLAAALGVGQDGRMITLALMRHAKSSWDDPANDDFDRSLNARGERSAPAVGAWLRDEQGFAPDLVLVSSARRTRQTWELIAPHLVNECTQIGFLKELYLASPRTIERLVVEAVSGAASPAGEVDLKVLVIAHNPGSESLLWHFSNLITEVEASASDDGLLGRPHFAGMMATGAVGVVQGVVEGAQFQPNKWCGYATPRALLGE